MKYSSQKFEKTLLNHFLSGFVSNVDTFPVIFLSSQFSIQSSVSPKHDQSFTRTELFFSQYFIHFSRTLLPITSLTSPSTSLYLFFKTKATRRKRRNGQNSNTVYTI